MVKEPISAIFLKGSKNVKIEKFILGQTKILDWQNMLDIYVTKLR